MEDHVCIRDVGNKDLKKKKKNEWKQLFSSSPL